MKTVAVSGYFDPPHGGHLALFEDAKKFGDVLIVIVNNDHQQKLKGSVPFMRLSERVALLQALKPVDMVVVSIDKDATVRETLLALRPDFFCNGGDRTYQNIPEREVCDLMGTHMAFGVGGSKINSSSKLIYEAAKTLGLVQDTPEAPVSVGEDYQSGGGTENLPSEPQCSLGVACLGRP